MLGSIEGDQGRAVRGRRRWDAASEARLGALVERGEGGDPRVGVMDEQARGADEPGLARFEAEPDQPPLAVGARERLDEQAARDRRHLDGANEAVAARRQQSQVGRAVADGDPPSARRDRSA